MTSAYRQCRCKKSPNVAGQEDSLAASVLKLKYYAGLSVDDAAEALGVSRATAYRHWTYARAWVRAELLDEKPGKNRSES